MPLNDAQNLVVTNLKAAIAEAKAEPNLETRHEVEREFGWFTRARVPLDNLSEDEIATVNAIRLSHGVNPIPR